MLRIFMLNQKVLLESLFFKRSTKKLEKILSLIFIARKNIFYAQEIVLTATPQAIITAHTETEKLIFRKTIRVNRWQERTKN